MFVIADLLIPVADRKIRPIFRAANLKNTFDCNKIWSKDFGVPSFGHSSSDSFCESMKFPILIGQFVCLIPLSSNEKLGWRSFRLCASLILIVGQIAMAILSLVWLHRGEVSIFKSGDDFLFSFVNPVYWWIEFLFVICRYRYGVIFWWCGCDGDTNDTVIVNVVSFARQMARH